MIQARAVQWIIMVWAIGFVPDFGLLGERMIKEK